MPSVLYEKKGRIAYITINRPEAMNAYNHDVLLGLEESFLEFDRDNDSYVAILTGAGNTAFCAGADLKEMASLGDPNAMYYKPDGTLIKSLQTRGLEIWKPIIAAVNGHCLAGGFDMALACDIRIASENATFGFSMVKRGLSAGGGLFYLARQVPLGMTMEMALTGDSIDVVEAYRTGLVNRVVPQGQLMAKAESLALTISENAPLGVRYSKETVIRAMNEPVELALRIGQLFFDLSAATEDAREGPRAWVEHRRPEWRGK